MKLALANLLLVLAACTTSGPSRDAAEPVRVAPTKIGATTGPYVSVAVDNHFHDVHPEDDVTIGVTRRFVVRNEGRNLHNVTIAEIDWSKDVRPGAEVRAPPLDPGTYRVVCRYHSDQGMTGKFTVVA